MNKNYDKMGFNLDSMFFRKQFNDSYDCMIKGYEESIKKTIEVGRDQVNNVGLYIKFSCTPIETI